MGWYDNVQVYNITQECDQYLNERGSPVLLINEIVKYLTGDPAWFKLYASEIDKEILKEFVEKFC